MSERAASARLPQVDALKVVAAQLIVMHHIAFYGPMSDHAALLAPGLFDWLARHARIAVQVFLVAGGYLAASSLAPQRRLPEEVAPLRALARRYLRLSVPLAAMLVVAIGAAAVARATMTHDSIPDPPSVLQIVAHLLLLQDLLDVDALSAGVWYVAIDFQLFVLLLGALALARAIERRLVLRFALAPWLVLAMVAASLLHFNRDPRWDVAAPYFAAAYGLGVLAAWCARFRRDVPALLGVSALVAFALVLDFRPRIVVAAAVAALLALLHRSAARAPVRSPAWLGGLARISYSVFLIHFPVLLLVNAFFTRYVPARPWPQMAGVLVVWAASIAAGALFHRFVEAPATKLADARGKSRRAR